jgi:hypothetical protein
MSLAQVRTAAMLATAIALVASAGAARGLAQPVAQAGAPAETPELVDLWLVIYNVRPASTGEFEAVATRVRDALRASTDPYRRRQAEGLRIHKSALPSPEGNAMYFVQVPTATGNEGDRTGLDVLIDAVLPAEATALKQRLQATLDPRNPSGHTLMLAIR